MTQETPEVQEDENVTRCWVLLRMDVEFKDPSKEIFILLKAYLGRDPTTDKVKQAAEKQYFYDQHTCPTNYLRVTAIAEITGNETTNDPHGLFQYWSHCGYNEGLAIINAEDEDNHQHWERERLIQHLRHNKLRVEKQ